MSDDQTTYLSRPGEPPRYQPPVGYGEPAAYQPPAAPRQPRKRMSPAIAGVVGLAVGAILGGGGVLLTHSSSSPTPPAGQMGNVNGGPGGTVPSGAPGNMNGAAPSPSSS